MKSSSHRQSRLSGFTLIELLVVIAIIAILAAILFPVFAQAKMAAKKTADLSNNKQMVLGFIMYANDVDDGLCFAWGTNDGNGHFSPPFGICVLPYIKNYQIFQSPVDNYSRGANEPDPVAKGQPWCDATKPAHPRTFAENWSSPTGSWGWGAGSIEGQMSPFNDENGGNIGTVPAVSTTILLAPRPNSYSQVCVGWATDNFFNYGEFNFNNGVSSSPGGGAKMFGNGTNYALCDGHAKFMTKDATLKAQGSQVGTPIPSYWPNDPVNWPWPAGMWDKRQ